MTWEGGLRFWVRSRSSRWWHAGRSRSGSVVTWSPLCVLFLRCCEGRWFRADWVVQSDLCVISATYFETMCWTSLLCVLAVLAVICSVWGLPRGVPHSGSSGCDFCPWFRCSAHCMGGVRTRSCANSEDLENMFFFLLSNSGPASLPRGQKMAQSAGGRGEGDAKLRKTPPPQLASFEMCDSEDVGGMRPSRRERRGSSSAHWSPSSTYPSCRFSTFPCRTWCGTS